MCSRPATWTTAAHIRWCLAHWKGGLVTNESQFSLYRADSTQCVSSCVGEWFFDVILMNGVARGGGGVMVRAGVAHEHSCILLMAFWRDRDNILRPVIVPFIHDHQPTLQHNNAHLISCVASILNGTCLGCSGLAYATTCSSSCQYPANGHSHWKGVNQHSTGHKPDQLDAKEMCYTAWGKWWSRHTLTNFLTPPGPLKAEELYI